MPAVTAGMGMTGTGMVDVVVTVDGVGEQLTAAVGGRRVGLVGPRRLGSGAGMAGVSRGLADAGRRVVVTGGEAPDVGAAGACGVPPSSQTPSPPASTA